MGSANSAHDSLSQGAAASSQGSASPSEVLVAQAVRQLGIDWNVCSREFYTVCTELLDRVLTIANEEANSGGGAAANTFPLTAVGSAGASAEAAHKQFGSGTLASSGSMGLTSGPSSYQLQPPPQQSHTTLPSHPNRALFSNAGPTRTTRSTSSALSSSFSGMRVVNSGAVAQAGASSSSSFVPQAVSGTAAANDKVVTPQDLQALAIAILSLDADGFFALVGSMGYVVSGHVCRESAMSDTLSPTSSSVQQGATSSGATHSDTPSRGPPFSLGSTRSISSHRLATSSTTGVGQATTLISRGASTLITNPALPSFSQSASSFFITHSQDSPCRGPAVAQLQQLQRQQEQMRFAPTSFGEHAYNNTLLMSMSARSSNSDLRQHTYQYSRQHSGALLTSSTTSSSALAHIPRLQQQQPRRGSSSDNLSAHNTVALSTPQTSRMLTPRAPSTFSGSTVNVPQSPANTTTPTGLNTSPSASQRPSFASGTRPSLSGASGSMVSMSSTAIAELPHNHHTAVALTYVPAEHCYHYGEKLVGHTPMAVLKSLNALLAHLHVPERSVTALWVLFAEVLCEVQERAQTAPTACSTAATLAASHSTATPASSSTFSRLGAVGGLQPLAHVLSLSSTDDAMLMSPGLMHGGSQSASFGRVNANSNSSTSAIGAACRLAVVPLVEKLVLPHYADVCAVLDFAAGSNGGGSRVISELTATTTTEATDEAESWGAVVAMNSEPRASSMDPSHRSAGGGSGAGHEGELRHSLSSGLPPLQHASSARPERPLQVPSAQSMRYNNYMVSAGASPIRPTQGRPRSGSLSRRVGREIPMASLSQQYFREECTMLLSGSGGGAGRHTHGNRNSSARAASTHVPRPATDTLLSDPLVQKNAFVLHYAERISLPPLDETEARSASSPSVKSLWQMRTRLVSLRQHYLYIYDAMATSIALLGGDLAATVALPSANIELSTPIALMDMAGAAGSDLCVVSGPSDAEVMTVRASGSSRGLSPQTDPLFTEDPHHNADLLKGTRAEDTTVYRVKNDEGELFLLVLPAAGQTTEDGSGEQDAVTATAMELEQRLSRPGVLSLMPADASNSAAATRPQNFVRVQGEKHVALNVHPLRILHQGVLHHFFFQNANVRAQWFDHMTATTIMLRSRQQLARVAAAPQCVSRFLHRRVSFPVGPAAFDYLDMLGVGGFGRVLLVRHKLSGKLFAMKIIRKYKFHGMRNVVEVRRECHTLRSVDCPYVMKIHTIFQTDSRVYILLDYLPGGELLVHTQKTASRRFDNDTARFFIAELAIALESLRVQGIVHRDIKGDNVVLDADGHAVLTDFGFAKKIVEEDAVAAHEAQMMEVSGSAEPRRADDDRHPCGRIRWQHSSCGTLAYLAPEVLQRTPPRNGYGLEADWWSLGVVLFTMLTGYFPFLKEDNDTTKRAIVASQLQFPKVDLSDAARDVMRRLMEKDPLKRISTLARMKAHPFFHGFDWTACEEKRLPPPVLLHKDMYRTPSSDSSDARRLRRTVVGILERERRRVSQLAARGDGDGMGSANSSAGSSPQSPGSLDTASPPTHVASNKKYARELQEEVEELQLVAKAFGPDTVPVPTTLEGDVFGPLYTYQEECGSDREDWNEVESPSQDSTRSFASDVCGLRQPIATSWFDVAGGNYIPLVDYAQPYPSHGFRSHGVGSGALRKAHEREVELEGDNALMGGSVSLMDDLGMSTGGDADGDYIPVMNDFDEAAYVSMQEVLTTDARLASDATGLFRPLVPDGSQY